MNDNIFRIYKEYKQKEFDIEISEEIDYLNIICTDSISSKLIEILEEEYFIYKSTETGFIIEHSSIDELIDTLSEYNITEILNEAAPVRKVVVRGGRRRVVFRCPPGQKKIKRRCVRRPASELARVKRGARKAARKARSKRARATRRRKISLKRRAAFAKKKHK